MQLKVDEEFKRLCPPLSPAERQMLTDNILAHGCTTPLEVWEGTIVDGHNRYEICTEHGIEFVCNEIAFASREDALEWIIKNQLGRRNLGFLQASYLRGCHYRMLRDAGKRKDGYQQEKLAKAFGVSTSTIRRDRELADAIDDLDSVARQFVLQHGINATHQHIVDLSMLDTDSQRLIIEKIHDGELSSVRDAIIKLRGPSRVGAIPNQRKANRCPTCGVRLLEGVYTCLKCDLEKDEVARRLQGRQTKEDERRQERLIEERIEIAKKAREHGNQIIYCANVIVDFLDNNEVEQNSEVRSVLSNLSKALLAKVGRRRENDKLLRSIVDPDEDKEKLETLTKGERAVFNFLRDFSMRNGRPPKLQEIADELGLGSRSHANGYIARLRGKGIVVRD